MRKLIFGVMTLALISFTSCNNDDDNNSVELDGGVLSGGPFTFTVGDGVTDNVSGITLTGNEGSNNTYVITDDANNILGLPGDITALEGADLDGAGGGICYIYHLSYEEGLEGLAMGENTDDLSGTFDLSNFIMVTRNAAISGGTLSGGPFTFDVSDGIADNVSGVSVEGAVGTNSTFIITDDANNILGLPGDLSALEGADLDGAGGGVCYIYHLSYEEGLEGLAMGENTADLSGEFGLSNFIMVTRNVSYSDLNLDISGLENLGDDYMYEGWVIVDGSPVTTGVFSVDDSGALSATTFSVVTTDLAAATSFVLSIEPTVDPDPAPAETKLLIGDFTGNAAMVSSNGIVADLTTSAGSYILATPTDLDETNEYSGVWFLDNSTGTAVAGLDLPELSAGWVYEGWVVIGGVPVSTGTFTDPAMADDNAATSPYKGADNDGPGYPGEDYVMGSAAGVDFPIDLRGSTVVVSVEPYPDNSDAPFTLKPLAGMIPTEAMTHTVQTLGEGPVVSILGTVTR